MNEKLLVYLAGFLAGLAAGILLDPGDGWWRKNWPDQIVPPIIPDYVPDDLTRQHGR